MVGRAVGVVVLVLVVQHLMVTAVVMGLLRVVTLAAVAAVLAGLVLMALMALLTLVVTEGLEPLHLYLVHR
jgi:hypothetical protein